MPQPFNERNRKRSERPDPRFAVSESALLRLEEIGDLHFEASAYTSALDYYRRLLDGSGAVVGVPRLLGVLRKSVDAALNIGDLALAESLLARASDIAGPDVDLDSEERAQLLAPIMGRRAALLTHRSAYAKALRLAKHAFAVLAITDSHNEVANLQVTMGVCHQRLGRLGKAEEFYTDALATYRRIGDEIGTAILYNNLALLHKNLCRWDRALNLQEKAVAVASRHGATHLLSRMHLNQGIILRKMGRRGEARSSLEKCLRLAISLGDASRQARASLALGYLELDEGHQLRAEELILAGKAISESAGYVREATIADEYMGDILLVRGDVDKALYNYEQGLEKTRAIGKVTDLEGELLRRCAEAYRRRGDLDKAVSSAEAAVAVCESCGEEYELGFCHRTLGMAHAARGDIDECDRAFRDSIALFRKQNLNAEMCESILAFHEARRRKAGRSQLLLLRRFLIEVLDAPPTSIEDDLVCRLHQSLAEVQLGLGQNDEALLTVSELERLIGSGVCNSFAPVVQELRQSIEQILVGSLVGAKDHLQAVSSVPALLTGGPARPNTLASVLQAGMARTGATAGFLAMADQRAAATGFSLVAREGVSENLAGQLAEWFDGRRGTDSPTAPLVFTRLSASDALVKDVPALADAARSCVFLPVALHGRLFGMMFLARRDDSDAALASGALEFLAAYLGFIALFLEERGAGGPASAPRPDVPPGQECFENFITGDERMLELLSLIRKVAPSELTVLLHGETGTGKGLLAYAIHALSPRMGQRFSSVNCAAIPETLLESELFGHVRGSFTGAVSDKPGLLVEAEGGTVFLDEVGKMPLPMQAKLLHFLDTKVIRPVGSARDRRVDVRIVCATKGDLQEMSRQGLFLEDLYYRLLDFPLRVPPLRERPGDIQLLVQHFIARFAGESGRPVPGFTAAFMNALTGHDWPGNVRELEKSLRRAIVLAQDDEMLRPEHLPTEVSAYAFGDSVGRDIAPLRETVGAVECREITAALKAAGGNKSQVCRMLGISYPSLLRKIRLYGIRLS